MPDPIKVGPFLGINNRLPSEKLVHPEGKGTFVRDAVNADLTEAGTFQRRGGYALKAAATRGRCLTGIGDYGYFVSGENVMRFDGTNSVAVGAVSAFNSEVSFTHSARGVLWTDGIAIQRIVGDTSQPICPSAPNPTPTVMADVGGSLAPGKYIVAFARVDADGVRSPLVGHTSVEVGELGAVAITTPAQADPIQVFMSGPNGSTMSYQTTIQAGMTSAGCPIFYEEGRGIDAHAYEAPLPGGTILREYRGRLFSVTGNIASFSKPFHYGVYNPTRDFIALAATITLFEPTQEGIFIATADETFFWDGTDITKAALKPIAPYGAVFGTVAYEPNSLNMWWQTPRGFVRTKDDNTLELRQDENIAVESAATGAAIYREQNGLKQVVSTLFDTKPTSAASAFSYMDAEIIK